MDIANRYAKDKEFKKIFYQKIDEMFACELLEDLQPNFEFLVYFSEQIDGKEVYQPLHGFFIIDLENFHYGLLNWKTIKELIQQGPIKQVDIIKFIDLDKEKMGFFLYTLDKIGVLKKEKQGRYNVYNYVTDRIGPSKLKSGWPNLFGESARVPVD